MTPTPENPSHNQKKRKANAQITSSAKKSKKLHRPDQCIEFLKAKGRQCRQPKLPHSSFCANHYMEHKQNGTLPENEQNLEGTDKVKSLRECPECGIAIGEARYRYHVENCPKVKRRKQTQQLECFVKNVNGNVPNQLKSLKEVKEEFGSSEEFLAFVQKINNAFEEGLKQSKTTWNVTRDTKSSVECTTITTSEDQSHFPVQIERPKCLESETSNVEQVARNKHIFQQASIAGIVMKNNCMDEQVRIVDMGAGKAELSFTFAQTLRLNNFFTHRTEDGSTVTEEAPSTSSPLENRFVLVDRKAFRRKRDNDIRMEHPFINKSNIQSCQEAVVRRLNIDIQDLHIGKVKELHQKESVCISKHLCGVATDLSLRCLELTNVSESSEEKHMHIRGYFICLCCHHVCHWEEYINQEFWQNVLNLSPNDFTLVKTMSSWAVSSFRENETHQGEGSVLNALSSEEKLEFGWKCKRLIDFGRIDFLRKRNYDAHLVQYIQKTISPECLMMVALPRSAEGKE